MSVSEQPASETAILTTIGLDALLTVLRERGYRVLGPTVRDQAIIYDDIASVADLPRGWTDEQAGGHYRLRRRADEALFGYAVGPQSWKRFLHPPMERLWRTEAGPDGPRVIAEPPGAGRFAFIGVRSCELHAIAIQDRAFLDGAYRDTRYAARRADAFLVAVNCGTAGGTCFCASMGTGPEAASGFDLVLTELLDGPGPRYLAAAGSEAGAAVLAASPCEPATDEDRDQARAVSARTREQMGREMRADDLPELLPRNLTHPRWDDVAARCLTCGNCTMVCPTCFCTSVEDSADLMGTETTRSRRWDSCFTMDFSFIHGGSVRSSARARYRQWMTHKLSTWHDQFGTSGCVGCGRCIAWCPVGIDITEEVRAIRGDDAIAGRPDPAASRAAAAPGAREATKPG
jgi:ferredoxin